MNPILRTHLITERAPSALLRPFVQCMRVVEFPPLFADTHLPDTSATAAFTLHGECRIGGDRAVPAAAFTGLHTRLRAHEHRAHTVLLVGFTPVGASAFLRTPMEEFSGATVHLSDAVESAVEIDRLQCQLDAAGEHGQRIALVDSFLRSRLRADATDRQVAAAIAWIQAHPTGRIRDLTDNVGLSQSALARRFRHVVGVTPKQFASMDRLRNAVRLRDACPDLASLAHAAGYYDQSHLIHDFQRSVGTTPNAYFRAR